MFKKSFYKETQKNIANEIKEDLLQLVLTHLPHLQLTLERQDDVWEFIAIKLNNKLLQDSFNGKLGEKLANLDELPTLNGPYIKMTYEKIFKDFRSNYMLTIANANPLFPGALAQELFKDHEKKILCKLLEMESASIDILAKISMENLEEIYRKELKLEFKAVTEYSTANTKADTRLSHHDLESEKEAIYKHELEKQISIASKLEAENKKLLALNQQLVEDMGSTAH